MTKKIWNHFVEQFGLANIVPIALAREGVKTTLPVGVLGKVPSIYTPYGSIAGYQEWQTCRATPEEIERWAADGRYGFGVVLGQPLPAGGINICIDADTENAEYQETVYKLITQAIGGRCPMRVRVNSNRRAYVLRVNTTNLISKRVLTLRKADKAKGIKGEAIEILGRGQQFAAWGRHPSGADLEWLDAPHDSLVKAPEAFLPDMSDAGQSLTLEAFNDLIDAIRDALPVISDTEKGARQRNAKGDGTVKADYVAEYLDAEGWTLSIGKEGARHLRSPFEHEYTNEQTVRDTSVTYLLPGTHGYEQGHFVSLHSSDATRSDADWLAAYGVIESQFEVIATGEEQANAASDSPGLVIATPQPLTRDKKNRVTASLNNLSFALNDAHSWGYEIACDDFRGETMIRSPGQPQWAPFEDHHVTTIRMTFENNGFKTIKKGELTDAIEMHAKRVRFDSAIQWLKSVQWDGTKRIDTFLTDYFGIEANSYTRAVSRYIWTALAGRVLKPGVKADGMPVFVGAQGCGKSRAVKALAPEFALPGCFSELSFNEKEDDLNRKMRGLLVGEWGELSGLSKKELEPLKAFITRTCNEWIEKYKTFKSAFYRRCIFFGTTNNPNFLNDPTGSRRFFPMDVGTINVEGIEQVCAQLWAEGAVLFAESGVLYGEALEAALELGIYDKYRVIDPLENLLMEYLEEDNDIEMGAPSKCGFLSTSDCLTWLKGHGGGVDHSPRSNERLRSLLLPLGWSQDRKKTPKGYLRGYSLTKSDQQ